MISAAAEMELLQLTAEAQVGYVSALTSAVGFALAFIIFFLLITLKGAEALTSAAVVMLAFALPSLTVMMFAIRRLRRVVMPREETNESSECEIKSY